MVRVVSPLVRQQRALWGRDALEEARCLSDAGRGSWLLRIGLELPSYLVQVLVPLKGATNIYGEGGNRQITKISFSSFSDEQFFSEEDKYQEIDFLKLGYNSHIIKLFFKNTQFSEFEHIQKVV